jgi:putative membrane protein
MDMSSFGFWAMIAFWGSAIGGIVIGISWARTRGRNPVDRDLLLKSLQSRLESGDISREEYEKKLNAVGTKNHDQRES